MINRIIKIFGNFYFLIFSNLFMFGWMFTQDCLTKAFDPYPYSMLQTVMAIVMFNIDILILISAMRAEKESREHTMYLREGMKNSLTELQAQKNAITREEMRDTITQDLIKELIKLTKRMDKND